MNSNNSAVMSAPVADRGSASGSRGIVSFSEDLIRGAKLITGPEGGDARIPLKRDGMRVVAVFSNGVCVIGRSEARNPHVRAAINYARKLQIGVSEDRIFEADAQTIQGMYQKGAKASASAPSTDGAEASKEVANDVAATAPLPPVVAPSVQTAGAVSAKPSLSEFSMKLVENAVLLTGPEDSDVKIPLKREGMRVVAIFSNGICLIGRSETRNQHVKTAVSFARKLEIGVSREKTFEVDPTVIQDIYLEGVTQSASKTVLDPTEARRQIIIRELLAEAAQEGATDLHILINKNGYANVRPRINNRLMKGRTLEKNEALAVMNAIFAVADGVVGGSSLVMRQGALTKPMLLPPDVEMVRLQFTPQDGGRGALAMRLKYRSKASGNSLDSLGYSKAQIRDLARMRRRTNGLYILSGKVSSGKSTTLQRILNLTYEENNGEILIYTVEEPVELELHEAIQFTAKNQVDPNDSTKVIDGFEAGIMGSLRSDMNVGVLGEIRNAKVAEKGIELVLTGHALWSTIHAGSALRILGRLADLGVDKFKLADPDVIAGLIYQRLIGVLCPHCKITLDEGLESGQITEDLHGMLIDVTGLPGDHLHLRGKGCDHPKCKGGLSGRTVAAEVIMPDEKLLSIFATTGDPMKVKDYWTSPDDPSLPKEERGMGGVPVIHHALIKVGAGLSDINEIEQEVNFLDYYVREFPHLISRLKQEIREMREEIGAKIP